MENGGGEDKIFNIHFAEYINKCRIKTHFDLIKLINNLKDGFLQHRKTTICKNRNNQQRIVRTDVWDILRIDKDSKHI